VHPFKFVVSLRIFSFDVDPVEISDNLGMEPKWMYQIGKPRATPDGKLLGGVYDCNYCSFLLWRQNDKNINAKILESVLSGEIDRLLTHKDMFLRIKHGGGSAEFFIGWFAGSNNGAIFNASLLKRMGELELDLSLDVYGGV
jgi:hypothetical protein